MNREEFLSQLERLLYDIPVQEREEALEYYNGYFDDAGNEKEAEVIQELGSPGKVAAIIKADLSGNEADYEEYTEQGYQDVRFDEKDMLKETNHYHQEESRYGQHTQKKRSGLTWGLVIVLVILTSPIWAGGGLGILGVLFGLIVGVLGIIAAIGIGGAALLIAGITAIVLAIIRLISSPGIFLIVAGGGMVAVAIAILILLVFLWIVGKGFPIVFRGCVDFLQRIFYKGRKGGQRV